MNDPLFDQDHVERIRKGCDEFNRWRVEDYGIGQPLKLDGFDFFDAGIYDLSGYDLRHSSLVGAKLNYLTLTNTIFSESNLTGASLVEATLLGTVRFDACCCHNADFSRSQLGDVDFSEADLTGALLKNITQKGRIQVRYAAVDGRTLFTIDGRPSVIPNFEGVAIDSLRMDPSLRALAKLEIRKRFWQDYGNPKHIVRWTTRFLADCFWRLSHYGSSTARLMVCFWGLTIAFSLIYYFGLNEDLVEASIEPFESRQAGVKFHRCWYFSLVTMTTLGFGDIVPRHDSLFAHIVIELQVLAGYFLLAALVTRMAILFDSVHE